MASGERGDDNSDDGLGSMASEDRSSDDRRGWTTWVSSDRALVIRPWREVPDRTRARTRRGPRTSGTEGRGAHLCGIASGPARSRRPV